MCAAVIAVVAALAAGCGGSDGGTASGGSAGSDNGRALPAPASAGGPFHSPDRLPPASWRPFASDSPWNQRIPSKPKLDPDSSRKVEKLFEAGPVSPFYAGTAGTASDFEHAVYFADHSDLLYTVQCGSVHGEYAVDGKHVRVPRGAQPAAGADHHLAIVYRGMHWGFYDASVDRETREIHCGAGRKVPIDGVGLHAAETAARFPSLAGLIRYQEVAAGHIDHALFAASSQVAYDWVYPAEKSDGKKSTGEGYPPMGTRLQLDPAYMTDERLAQYPPWKRPVLRAIRDYGFYLGDSTDASLKLLPFESGTSYTSFGLPDPWVRYAKKNGLPESNHPRIEETVYEYDLEKDVDWSKLRVIDSCLAAKDC
jgi:hypothetical protein